MKHERSIQGAPQRAANELHYIAAVAVTAALLIASSRVDHPSSATLIGAYTYWIVRIAIESTFFVLARDALMRSFQKVRSACMMAVAAMLNTFAGMPIGPAESLARTVDRGRRSAVPAQAQAQAQGRR